MSRENVTRKHKVTQVNYLKENFFNMYYKLEDGIRNTYFEDGTPAVS